MTREIDVRETELGQVQFWDLHKMRVIRTCGERQDAIRSANRYGVKFPDLNLAFRRIGWKPYYPRGVNT